MLASVFGSRENCDAGDGSGSKGVEEERGTRGAWGEGGGGGGGGGSEWEKERGSGCISDSEVRVVNTFLLLLPKLVLCRFLKIRNC